MQMKIHPEANQKAPPNQQDFLFKSGTSQEFIDSEVWIAFKQGNQQALDYIFEKYVRLLYAYGARITKNGNLVEDCIQDIFVELWQKREVVSEINGIKFYLLKSLRRRILRVLSGQRESVASESTWEGYEGEVEFSVEFKLIQEQVLFEQREKLFKALSLLSERQREAVYLKFYEKVSYEEIAEIMGLGIKSAYNLVGKTIGCAAQECFQVGVFSTKENSELLAPSLKTIEIRRMKSKYILALLSGMDNLVKALQRSCRLTKHNPARWPCYLSFRLQYE
jgi:RNA polymerase sigma factor (sigma-70 family)